MVTQKKNRAINFRSFLLITAVIISAVICGYLTQINKTAGWIVFVIALFVFTAVILLSFAYLKRTYVLISVIISAVMFIIVFINIVAVFENRHNKNIVEKRNYEIAGTIDSINHSEPDFVIVLKDVSIGVEQVKGKCRVVVPESKKDGVIFYAAPGDAVKFKSAVYFVKLVSDSGKVNTASFKTNVRYTSYVDDSSSLSFTTGRAGALKRLSMNIETILENAMGGELGGLAFGILTGDKTGIADEARNSFNVSGLGHLLAVSGLHIGFICAALTKLFDALRVNKKVTFFIVLSFLIFYMVLSDFSSSVIRAIIMCAVMSGARLINKWYDPLSSLQFAVCVILTLFPLYLFDAGFNLSATAVFGIIIFSKSIKKFFMMIKFPKFIAASLSTVISVQIGILPAMIFYFKEIQIYSIFVNLLLMPLISITFMAILISLVLTLIFPFFSILISFSGILLSFINTVAYAVSLLPYSLIYYSSTALIMLSYIPYFFISRFYMKRRKVEPVKIISLVLCAALSLSGLVLDKGPKLDNALIPLNSYSSFSSIVINEGKTYVVGAMPSANILESYIKSKYFKETEAIFLTSLSKPEARQLANFVRRNKVNKIYLPLEAEMDGLELLIEEKVDNFYLLSENDLLFDAFNAIYEGENFLGYKMKTKEVSLLFSKKLYLDKDAFIEAYNDCAIIRTFWSGEASDGRILLCNYSTENSGGNTFDYNYLLDFKKGTIYKNVL